MIPYNININTPIFSTSFPLTNNLNGLNSNFNNLMLDLIDNDDKLIIAKTLRDFVLSINDSTVFKLTENKHGKFIGFDKGNPSDPDLKDYKIVLGNKLHNNNPIINQNVIDSNTDIIISKTTNSNLNKISILTNSINSPSLEVDIDLNIKNKNNINLDSLLDSVIINNLSFPTKAENEISNINNKFLILEDSKLIWKEISTNLDSSDITQDVNIIGNVQLNNFNLKFTDRRRSPINIGDIKIGESFLDLSISDILKKIIYDYLPPDIELSFNVPYSNNTIEVGSVNLPKVSYKVFKKTKPVSVSFVNLIPSSIPMINNSGHQIVDGILDTTISGNVANISYIFSAILNDSTNNIQKNITLNGVYPYFYGFTNKNILDIDFLSVLTKDVKNKSNTTIDLINNGTFYFIYPHSYGLLSQVISNSLPLPQIYSNFFDSSDNKWSNIRFYVYQFDNTNITLSEKVSFII